MPYKVIAEEVSMPKNLGESRDEEGKLIDVQSETKVYLRDAVIDDEDMMPYLVKQYEDGDKHVRQLIVKSDEEGNAQDEIPEPEPEQEDQGVIVSKGGTGEHTVTDTGVEREIAASPVETPKAAKEEAPAAAEEESAPKAEATSTRAAKK